VTIPVHSVTEEPIGVLGFVHMSCRVMRVHSVPLAAGNADYLDYRLALRLVFESPTKRTGHVAAGSHGLDRANRRHQDSASMTASVATQRHCEFIKTSALTSDANIRNLIISHSAMYRISKCLLLAPELFTV
jgi:hypothetical protein